MITKKGQDYSLNGVDYYTTSASTYLLASNNLSDLVNVATARINLGVPSITNQANNRVVTSTAVTDVLNGEANLTFDGSTLTITGTTTCTGQVNGAIFYVSANDASLTPQNTIVQAGGGDAASRYQIVGRNVAIGIDNTDDIFRIYGGTGLGQTDGLCALSYDYNGGVALVGIGEATPLYTLHVTGTFYLSGAYSNDLRFNAASRLIAPADVAGTAYNLTIRASDTTTVIGGNLILNGGDSTANEGGTVTIGGGNSGTLAGSVFIDGGNGVATHGSVYIGSNYGNIFIGDTSNTVYVQVGSIGVPTALKGILHITGSTAVDSFPHLYLENLDNTHDTTAIFSWNAATQYSVGIDQSASRKFKIYNGTALGDTVANIGYSFFVSGGLPYVGIGKEAAATYTLDVTGDIRVTDDLFVDSSLVVGDTVTIANDDIVTAPTLTISNASIGDAALCVYITGQGYTLGVDNSDGNKFKICGDPAISEDLVTTDALCGFVYDYNAGVARVGIAESTPLATLHVGGNVVLGTPPGDALSPAYSNVKTLYYTIGLAGLGCDYSFTSVGNVTEQDIQLGGGAIIPAFSRVIDVVIVCTAALVGGTMAVDVGSTGAGAEYIAAAACDALNETFGAIINTAFWVAPANAASSVYFCATPSANWDTLTLGKWAVYITYIDNSAVA